MNLVIDENIAFANEAFSQFGNVFLTDGRNINNEILADANALIVRSITNVNQQLLQNTKIKFVGTATIGTEHIDVDFLKKKNISFADAKGCNADSVAEYVFTSLLNVAVKKNISLHSKTIGVIGVGSIGSRVVRYAESIGLKVLKNDPPKEREGIGSNYVSLDEALSADIITLHVPMNKSGVDKTSHLIDEDKLRIIKEGAILINTSRGAVVDNNALLIFMDNKELNVILDVWENEPSIDVNLLKMVDLCSAHVAGYSLEGKANGTKMIYDALCKFTGHTDTWKPVLPDIENNEISLQTTGSFEENLFSVLNKIYKIEADDNNMRKLISMSKNQRANYFDKLRKEYPVRREFCNYNVLVESKEDKLSKVLKTFRFNLKRIN